MTTIFPKWRNATVDDLETIDRIAKQVHPTLAERPEIFAEKFRLFPEGCFVFASDQAVTGYGVSHPWWLNNVPPLDTFLGRLPESAECMYIHDVALLTATRGRGAAGAYVKIVADIAKRLGLRHLALVSVYETSALWRRFGFKVVNDAALEQKLASYGDIARYMVRSI